MSSRTIGLILTLLLAASMAIGCVPLEAPAPASSTTQASAGGEVPLFYAAYATPIREPWDAVIHEPAYLCGMLAGGLTQSNTIGVVAGFPVAEVSRLVNAFSAGVAETNPEAKVLVTFINDWLDPVAAGQAAEAQIAAGADVLFGERAGVIQAAAEHEAFAFGNLSDQNALGPEWVVTGPVWNMTPTVAYVIDALKRGC